MQLTSAATPMPSITNIRQFYNLLFFIWLNRKKIIEKYCRKKIYQCFLQPFLSPACLKNGGGYWNGRRSRRPQDYHTFGLISQLLNKDRVLKFKICSKQNKMYLKKILFCSRLIRLVSLKKMKFRCADTLAKTA